MKLNRTFEAAWHGALTASIMIALCLTKPAFEMLGLSNYVFSVFVTLLGSYLGSYLGMKIGAKNKQKTYAGV
jgi:hypothetical protein